MIVGLGIDLVEESRTAASLARWGERLVQKLMDPEEAERLGVLSDSRPRALAISIALKEAGSKAIGTGWSRGVRWRDVIVEPGHAPRVRLVQRALDFARRLGSEGRTHATVEIRGDLVLAEVRLLTGQAERP